MIDAFIGAEGEAATGNLVGRKRTRALSLSGERVNGKVPGMVPVAR